MTDRAWEEYGRRDAYFGVLNESRYRGNELDDMARAEFFASGTAHVDSLFRAIQRCMDGHFTPHDVLDFGCGVGRLVIPFSRRCAHVMGVDVSPSMLAEAQRNCEREGVTNATFALSDDQLSAVGTEFDLVHSFIVLQHIAPVRGERLIQALLHRVRRGGVAALHVTYARRASAVRKIVNRLRRTVPLANGLVNLVQGRRFSYPLMAMHEYDLRSVLSLFQAAGFSGVHLEFTDHGGHLGAMLYAQRSRADAVR